jgi:hypothetical protein
MQVKVSCIGLVALARLLPTASLEIAPSGVSEYPLWPDSRATRTSLRRESSGGVVAQPGMSDVVPAVRRRRGLSTVSTKWDDEPITHHFPPLPTSAPSEPQFGDALG